MASTYTPIQSTTLTSTQSSVSLTSIPSTYTDLVLVFQAGISSGTAYLKLNVNSDTGSNYSNTNLRGNGSAAASGRDSNIAFTYLSGGNTLDTSLTTSSIINFQNYSNTTTYKTILSRNNKAETEVNAFVALWRSTSAISSIQIATSASTFVVGSTFSLYGIKAA